MAAGRIGRQIDPRYKPSAEQINKTKDQLRDKGLPTFSMPALPGSSADTRSQSQIGETYKTSPEELAIKAEQDRLSEVRKNQQGKLETIVRGRASTLLTGGLGLLEDAPTARRILLGA